MTDLAQAPETTIEQLIPNAFHNTEQHQNNLVECGHYELGTESTPHLRLIEAFGELAVVI